MDSDFFVVHYDLIQLVGMKPIVDDGLCVIVQDSLNQLLLKSRQRRYCSFLEQVLDSSYIVAEGEVNVGLWQHSRNQPNAIEIN